MLQAICTLLLYQLIGETLSFALALPIPGPVIGMALLLTTLALRPALHARIKATGDTLLSHLSLLFVPAGVGVMVHFARLADEGVAIVAAVVCSTLLAIVATAATAAFLIGRTEARRAARTDASR
ncbi:MAG: CidA/LrgA family protein [Burkholderiaceae bacterium]